MTWTRLGFKKWFARLGSSTEKSLTTQWEDFRLSLASFVLLPLT